jgi:hypothetical protein
MIRSGEECEGAVAVTYPDLGGSGIEIEDAFFGDLGCGIGGGEDFDANLRGAGEKGTRNAPPPCRVISCRFSYLVGI